MLMIKPIAPTPYKAIMLASAEAPYLKRLINRQGGTLDSLKHETPESVFERVLADLASVSTLPDEAAAMSALRKAKQEAHLVLSAADLSGHWSVMRVTEAMTQFADAAAEAALLFALNAAGLSSKGIFLVALGKMGAFELNYSSDIDIAAFYEPDLFDGGPKGASAAASRVVQHMTRLLQDQTGDGYVLRTDLRLRPDPRSTPVAVSTKMAELYYESVGQNWERMVWIKARAFAGDTAAAESYLHGLRHFVWRNHLDYWAIGDIHAIKNMINSSANRTDLDRPDADVKLGPGGIREIEFFAQTQQLILGGRDPDLRQRDTLGALSALVKRGAVEPATAVDLEAAYLVLRAVEHRVQMRTDEQTHALPVDDQARAQVARLCGHEDLGAFDAALLETRKMVQAHYQALFGREARETEAAHHGNLVFTGVDDDPQTVATLQGFGFQSPAALIETIRHWHRGYTSATRTSRGRELLTALLPALLSDMSETGEPDQAFRHFTSFFEALPSGVQTLSMLLAEVDLRKDLIATLALAPRLGLALGKRPGLLEALLQRDLVSAPVIGGDMSFEEAMDAARDYVADQGFLIGHDLLHGRIPAIRGAEAFSDLADWAITAMAGAAEAECERRFGLAPGDWCVVAQGRLGGRAMTAQSDLDIMVLYEPRSDDAQMWFTRFTQRLITALSSQTSKGGLYEVDIRLRPSGRSGPVAVRVSSFETYHQQEAWTWERMALTRLRPIVDRGALGEKLNAMTASLLAEAKDSGQQTADILDMRRRLAEQKPGQGPWDLKQDAGGMIDLEFVIQNALLKLGTQAAHTPKLEAAIEVLKVEGQLAEADASTLSAACATLGSLLQVQRIALVGELRPELMSAGLKDRLVRAVGADSFEAVCELLQDTKAAVAEIRARHIGPIHAG